MFQNKKILKKLIKPTRKAKKALKRLGVKMQNDRK